MTVSFDLVESVGFLPVIPHPSSDDNKYTRGKLVVIGGSASYPGAAALAAQAGQRMGAGYVEVLCAAESAPTVRSFGASLVVRPWGSLLGADLAASKEGKPVAYVVGPGFDAVQSFECELLGWVLGHAQAPVLVDGGALGCLAAIPNFVDVLKARAERGFTTVLTPHGGEAAKLADALGVARVERNADSETLAAFARALAAESHAVVVLKGPDTYVSYAERVLCVTEGTPALAKAGTGDVLAGLIGAYVAQGVTAFEAAVSGVMMHARAGCVAAERVTTIAAIPEDVVACIPDAIRSFAD